MANLVRASSGLAYPERFYAAASYVGLDGSQSSVKQLSSKFTNDTALLLCALHQQGLGTMPSIEAMSRFVKTLEEENPGWYPRASNYVLEPAIDVLINVSFGSQVITYSYDPLSACICIANKCQCILDPIY